MRQLPDEIIRKKKDKTLSKHYSILINGKQQKILNYKIRYAQNDKKVVILELISKFKFADNLNTEQIIVIIMNSKKKLHFKGTFSFAAITIGNYSLGIKLEN